MSKVSDMEREIENFIADEFSFGKSYECQALWNKLEAYKQAIREEEREKIAIAMTQQPDEVDIQWAMKIIDERESDAGEILNTNSIKE